MSRALRAYLALEAIMMEADDAGDPLADVLRDVLGAEDLWAHLTEEEIVQLILRPITRFQLGFVL